MSETIVYGLSMSLSTTLFLFLEREDAYTTIKLKLNSLIYFTRYYKGINSLYQM